ncbi:MAG: hypothetical protein HN932_12795 [Candidatus Marinimicrobia bacterium]|jgi:hypothetical protein|nr:hypothetical protein [Candidatus Neomarinimicrobiota bacterium]MBT7339091.1 hypothetical protein [Candidatus Jacksonbacteria bacterium]
MDNRTKLQHRALQLSKFHAMRLDLINMANNPLMSKKEQNKVKYMKRALNGIINDHQDTTNELVQHIVVMSEIPMEDKQRPVALAIIPSSIEIAQA